MTYHFSAPEHHPTDEEKKLEILKYLNNGCWLADTLHKETVDTQLVHEHDHVAFFVEKFSMSVTESSGAWRRET